MESYKIILFGDPAVGKTSISHRFISNEFSHSYKMTLSIDIRKKKVKVDEKEAILDVWDLCGAGGYYQKHFLDLILKGADGCLLVYDVQKYKSIENLIDWIKKIKNLAHNFNQISFIVVGNKIDLKEKEQNFIIPSNKIDEILINLNITNHIFASAKTGENVDEAFELLVREILKNENG